MTDATNNERPTLSDPAEWAIVRQMYFDGNGTVSVEQVDPIERLERMQSKQRNLNNNSR